MSAILEQKHLFEDAQSRLRAGDTAGAAAACQSALEKYPGDANLMCLAAQSHLLMSNAEQARDLLEEAIRMYPDFAVAHDVYGDLMLSHGHVDAAIKAYEQTLRLDPSRPAVISKIEKAESLLDSAPAPEATITAQPKKRRMAFEEDINHAVQLYEAGSPEKAESIYRDILSKDPQHVEAARLLARIAADGKRYRDAEVMLRHAAVNAPDYGRIWVDLANVLREQEKLEEALECAEKTLALGPGLAESHMLYAAIIGSLGDHESAIRSFEKALEIQPERTGAMCNIGHHLKTIGRQDESVAMYRHCIATEHDHAESYWSLANLKTFSFEVSEVEAMHTLLKDKLLADNSQAQIHNALGLHYESIKDYDSAFKHFEYCNLIARKQEKYDLVENEDIHDRTISLFTEDFFLSRDGTGCADPAPIFIVGLPRSGSTLIEQILASHSQVDGTHELGDLGRQVKKLQKGSKPGERFPETILDVAPEDWRGLGDGYLRTTAKFRGDAAYFIDKNPNNYSLIGILRLALPNARIVNARRHPLDSCFGSYKQLFASGQPFSYDLEEVGEYYLQYQRLMDHWHAVLPGYVLDVQYEHVVAELETQVRRILDFCGLPFEESCLNFHETERAVKTASSEQVRRPIYASSVNLWRNYEKHLGELVHVVEPLLRLMPVDEQPAGIQKY